MKMIQNSYLASLPLFQAIEESPRPINKKAVVRDLETILAQEIHLGYLVKVIPCCPSAEQI